MVGRVVVVLLVVIVAVGDDNEQFTNCTSSKPISNEAGFTVVDYSVICVVVD